MVLITLHEPTALRRKLTRLLRSSHGCCPWQVPAIDPAEELQILRSTPSAQSSTLNNIGA